MGRPGRRICPLCGWSGLSFTPFGKSWRTVRLGRCPRCHSLERHRFAYLLLRDMIGDGHATLHVAPEPELEGWLRSVSGDYLSIDLERRAMRHMDLTALDLPDGSRTLVWCSHVLEHIPEDRRAMAEMFRVLTPGGLAVVQVPVRGHSTYEDPSITSPPARLRHFLQRDHVRIYGLDVGDRLAAAGFEVEVRRAREFPAGLVRRCGLRTALQEEAFLCRKPGRRQ